MQRIKASQKTESSTQCQFPQVHEHDYEHIARSPEVSLKYCFTLNGKTIQRLNQDHPEESIHNIPIVCSYADMEFKLSPQIQKDWTERLSNPQLNLGYLFLPSSRQEIVQRLKKNMDINYKKQDLILINSMLTFYHLVVTELTQKGDQVLIFTPTYYRFMFTINTEGRQVIEYELRTKQSENGETNFYVDFEQLQKLFEKNKIKMLVFANPHNPAGKIWSREEISEIKRLCLKFNCLVFSDDIFCDCIQNPREKYNSLLQFPEIHNNLIWASSFGKAFNCSGNSFTYAVVQNPEIRAKISDQIMKLNLYPTYAAGKLLESCYTAGDGWRLRTIKYIKENYALLKQEIKKRNLKINLYKLQSAFLPILDFAEYKWPLSQIKKRLDSQNIFPTYFDTCYVKRQTQSISCVRFNIAMNRKLLEELIDRLQKALRN